MIAASRRWANERPWQVFSKAESSSLVKTGTSFSLTFGARSGCIGSGICSSSASQRKNCCSARNWLLAYASLYRVSRCTSHRCTSWPPTWSHLV